MNCTNCPSEAIYVLNDARASTVYYCGSCLPPHLSVLASKGLLNIPAPVVEPEEVAPAKKKKAAETPVVEEPSVESTEEPSVEE
jgi:hypothetical protein